jgi:hypothetical protein
MSSGELNQKTKFSNRDSNIREHNASSDLLVHIPPKQYQNNSFENELPFPHQKYFVKNAKQHRRSFFLKQIFDDASPSPIRTTSIANKDI